MELKVLRCPDCGAPLSVSKFQRQVACAFCHAQVQIDPTLVHAARFREALADWNGAGTPDDGARVVVGSTRFRLLALIAHGEVSDVHVAERDRWPTERVLLKIARDASDRPLLEAEHAVLSRLQASTAKGDAYFMTLLPQPVLGGVVREGPGSGRPALALRWSPGFGGRSRMYAAPCRRGWSR